MSAATLTQFLIDITRGHPYATQELAYSLWEDVPEGFTATVDDLWLAGGAPDGADVLCSRRWLG
jgi:hypothetical protein